jgi:hypothetical protein
MVCLHVILAPYSILTCVSRYVLSPTHLHEFKSADKNQAPIMSLYLAEQKLGSHSTEGSSSNKFMLKGRQTGSMHRGHSWVFRAESYDTMQAWYEDIKTLTEKSPQERNAFVRQHARSISRTSQRSSSRAGSVSSDGIVDEEDDEPFSASNSGIVSQEPKQDVLPKRPQPGGRFPSADVLVTPLRGLQVPLSPSSGSSGFGDVQDRDVIAAAALPGSDVGQHYGEDSSPTHAAMVNQYAKEDGVNPYTYQPIQNTVPHQPNSGLIEGAVAGGLVAGGVATGVAYAKHEEKAANDQSDFQQQQEYRAGLEQQAAAEASIIASPDAPLDPIVSDSNMMSGGRGQGDPASDTYPEQAADGEAQTQNVRNSLETVLRPLADDLAAQQSTLSVGQNYQSVTSISQLHVPGEFPKVP